MPVTDPIADMLTRVRNAISMQHREVLVPHSALKSDLLKLMTSEGFISGFTPEVRDDKKVLLVHLNYYDDQKSAINGLKRVSKPGLRRYVSKNNIPNYYGGLGTAFLSTSKGLMTGREARAKGVGGELLFFVW